MPFELERGFIPPKPHPKFVDSENDHIQRTNDRIKSLSLFLSVTGVTHGLLVFHKKWRPGSASLPAVFVGMMIGGVSLWNATNQRRRHQIGLEKLKTQGVEGTHFMRMDSLAPPIPCDQFTVEGERAARALLAEAQRDRVVARTSS